ncbi:MAG: hypothetical protein AAGD22_10505 [Verrucomicrobiota bacterium]
MKRVGVFLMVSGIDVEAMGEMEKKGTRLSVEYVFYVFRGWSYLF